MLKAVQLLAFQQIQYILNCFFILKFYIISFIFISKHSHNIYMLNRVNKVLINSFAIEKKLFVYDSGRFDPFVNSGIRATIFGPTGIMGRSIAARLGEIGSQIVMPIAKENKRHYEHPKELKVVGHTHKTWLQWDADMRDQRFIEDCIKNSNVVVNLLGPRKRIKRREDFEFINIQVPQRIAHACRKAGVMRLVHFSAAAADPNSPSLDFQTKWEGQQAVKKAFPDVTIFRPCTIYGQNDYFAHNILRQSLFFFHKFVLVYDDCTTIKQPIRDHDVSLAVLNALKMDETKGNTYELGGPHQLSMIQIHEIIFNLLNVRPQLAYVNPNWAMAVAKRIYNWQFLGQQVIRKKTIPEVVSGKYGTIQDLHVEPVSFKNGIFDIMREYIFVPGLNDQDVQK